MKSTITTWTALLVLIATGHSIAAADTLRTVAFSGNTAPGTPTGVNFSSFASPPVLNNAGQTAFLGSLIGTGVSSSNDTGIWSEGGDGVLTLVARTGNQAPDTPVGANFASLDLPLLNNAGQTTFRGVITGTGVSGTNDTGIWSEGGGSGLALVAREGNPAPNTPVGIRFADFQSFAPPVFNDAGQVAFRGFLKGNGVSNANNTGIWTGRGGGELALVIREGNPAPGTQLDVVFSSLGVPVLNGAGQTAFLGAVAGPGVSSENNDGIWKEGASGLTLVIREGNQGPGVPSGLSFSRFLDPVLNDAGHTGFRAIVGFGAAGIWSERGGGLALIAFKGNQAPGTPVGVEFHSLISPVINGAGQTAFWGSIGTAQGGPQGIWSEGGGSGLALVAHSGNSAPDTPTGVNFSGFGDPVLNGAGQTAFEGSLHGTGLDGRNNQGIWAENPSGELRLIARIGDLLDVDDGPGTDFHTISSLSFTGGLFPGTNTGNEDGRKSAFNDRGQLAFFASFTDGSSGVFVSNLVAVPEPSTLLLGALTAVGLLQRKKHRDVSVTLRCTSLHHQ